MAVGFGVVHGQLQIQAYNKITSLLGNGWSMLIFLKRSFAVQLSSNAEVVAITDTHCLLSNKYLMLAPPTLLVVLMQMSSSN